MSAADGMKRPAGQAEVRMQTEAGRLERAFELLAQADFLASRGQHEAADILRAEAVALGDSA